MIAPKQLTYIPAGFAHSRVLRWPPEHPVTKQNVPPPFWEGRVSLALGLLSDPHRGTPLQQERAQQTLVTSPGTLLAQQPRLQMTLSDPQRASRLSPTALAFASPAHIGFGWASQGMWITDLSQLLITINELGRKELATNLCWSQHLARDQTQLKRLRLTIQLQAKSCPTYLLGPSAWIQFSCSLANPSLKCVSLSNVFHLRAGFDAQIYNMQT